MNALIVLPHALYIITWPLIPRYFIIRAVANKYILLSNYQNKIQIKYFLIKKKPVVSLLKIKI